AAGTPLQPYQLEGPGDAIALLAGESCRERPAHALVRLHRELQIFERGVVLENGRLLKFAPDAGVRDLPLGDPRHIYGLAEDRRSRIRSGFARDDVQHRSLARAVRPDHAAPLADVDRKGQIVERLEPVEADRDALEVQDYAVRGVELARHLPAERRIP